MSILQGATNVAILGGTQVAAAAGSNVTVNQIGQPGATNAFKDLSTVAAHAALYDSAARPDAPRCHRNTRAKYLDGLERWLLGQGEDHDGMRLIWLHGGAGAGKSAIMQSIVERCARHAVILGTFFFSRADPSRNYAEVLIPTLAYQLACMFPAAMIVLEPIISRNPLIFKVSLQTQVYELLVRPLLYLIEVGVIDNTYPLRRVFVIDGLDECNDTHKQALIIKAVASIMCEYHVPIHFLIASRPELAITSAFQREKSLDGMFATITLDDDDDSESDIRQFIEDSFLDILDSHPWKRHIKLPWPGPRSVDILVWNSSGHFIYAATAMKFIASSDEHPVRALEVVKGLQPSRTESPFAQLDALYLHILTTAKYSSQVLGILRHCFLTFFHCSVAAVCYVYGISQEDVELFLSDVQSLVSLIPDESTGMRIHLKHASLRDFLTDEKRSQRLYITEERYHASFLARYFQLVDYGPQASMPFLITENLSYLVWHLADSIAHSQDIDLLQSLVAQYSPQDIWNFCMRGNKDRAKAFNSSEHYIRSICGLIPENKSAIHQFKTYIQILLDNLDKDAHRKQHFRALPALIFSSGPLGLYLVGQLIDTLGPRFYIPRCYCKLFLGVTGPSDRQIDARYFKAIRSLPQSQLSWGFDLAITLKLILRQLVDQDLMVEPKTRYSNPHRQWLQKKKPWKQTSLGTPMLSSRFYSYLSTSFLHGDEYKYIHQHYSFAPEGPDQSLSPFFYWQAKAVRMRRIRCMTLLKAVVFYLHKSNRTSEVVKLARRLLPRSAMVFPKLMKRARAEMDAYVLHWEESPDGLLEKANLLSINCMD